MEEINNTAIFSLHGTEKQYTNLHGTDADFKKDLGLFSGYFVGNDQIKGLNFFLGHTTEIFKVKFDLCQSLTKTETYFFFL